MAEKLSPRERRLIRQILGEWQRWAPGERLAPVVGQPFVDGHSNRVLRLIGARQHYVLRIGRRPRPAGVDRRREALLMTRAARRGLAPTPLLIDRQRDLLITPFHPAATRHGTTDLAKLLRAIHSLPWSGQALHSAQQLQRLWHALDPRTVAARALAGHRCVLEGAMRRTTAGPGRLRCCHNDLRLANRRSGPKGLVAIDWEYARPGDPFFDLAVCASELPGEEQALLETYLGRLAESGEQQRFVDQQRIYAAIEVAWYGLFSDQKSLLDTSRQRLDRRITPP